MISKKIGKGRSSRKKAKESTPASVRLSSGRRSSAGQTTSADGAQTSPWRTETSNGDQARETRPSRLSQSSAQGTSRPVPRFLMEVETLGRAPGDSAATVKQKQRSMREKQEDAWASVRPALVSKHMETTFERNILVEKLRTAERKCLQAQVNAFHANCPTCGFLVDEPSSAANVQYIGLNHAHFLQCPVFTCQLCTAAEFNGSFSIHPYNLDAFPVTPVVALDFSKAVNGRDKPLILDRRLLKFYLTLKEKSARTSIEALACTLYDHLVSVGGELPVASDTLRKLLAKALEEFTCLDTELQNPALHGVPSNGLFGSTCGACAGIDGQEHLMQVLRQTIRPVEISQSTAAGVADVEGTVFPNGTPMDVDLRAGAEANGGIVRLPVPSEDAGGAAHEGDEDAQPDGRVRARSDALEGALEIALDGAPSSMQPAQARTWEEMLIGRSLMHSVYVDGCFGMPHLRGAGSATKHNPLIQIRLLPDDEVKDFCLKPEARDAGEAPPACVDFAADKVLGRTSARYDRTGVAGIFCRHGMVLAMINMFTGEQWSYSTFLMKALLEEGVLPLFWWYDINCRYKPHVRKWAETASNNGTLEGCLAEWVQKGIQFPLPVWHHYMHNAACQSLNSSRQMPGAGCGVGEPPEAAWSSFRKLGFITQYSSLPVRALALERAMLLFNKQKQENLPLLLTRQFFRAALREERSRLSLNKVFADLVKLKGSVEEANSVLDQRNQSRGGVTTSTELSWEAQLVEAMLQTEAVAAATTSRVVPTHLLVGSQSGGQLKPGSKFAKGAASREKKLREDHPGEGLDDWKVGHPRYDKALYELAAQRMREFQNTCIRHFQELTVVTVLFKTVHARRKDTRKLIDVKQTELKKLKVTLGSLVEWCHMVVKSEECLNLAPMDTSDDAAAAALPSDAAALAEAKAVLSMVAAASTDDKQTFSELLAAVRSGEFPWANASVGAGDGSTNATVERLRIMGQLAQDENTRAREEMALLVKEAVGLTSWLEERADVFLATIEEHVRELEHLPDPSEGFLAFMSPVKPFPDEVCTKEQRLAHWVAETANYSDWQRARRLSASIDWLNKAYLELMHLQERAEATHKVIEPVLHKLLGIDEPAIYRVQSNNNSAAVEQELRRAVETLDNIGALAGALEVMDGGSEEVGEVEEDNDGGEDEEDEDFINADLDASDLEGYLY